MKTAVARLLRLLERAMGSEAGGLRGCIGSEEGVRCQVGMNMGCGGGKTRWCGVVAQSSQQVSNTWGWSPACTSTLKQAGAWQGAGVFCGLGRVCPTVRQSAQQDVGRLQRASVRCSDSAACMSRLCAPGNHYLVVQPVTRWAARHWSTRTPELIGPRTAASHAHLRCCGSRTAAAWRRAVPAGGVLTHAAAPTSCFTALDDRGGKAGRSVRWKHKMQAAGKHGNANDVCRCGGVASATPGTHLCGVRVTWQSSVKRHWQSWAGHGCSSARLKLRQQQHQSRAAPFLAVFRALGTCSCFAHLQVQHQRHQRQRPG